MSLITSAHHHHPPFFVHMNIDVHEKIQHQVVTHSASHPSTAVTEDRNAQRIPVLRVCECRIKQLMQCLMNNMIRH